jgi:hypothetical protein
MDEVGLVHQPILWNVGLFFVGAINRLTKDFSMPTQWPSALPVVQVRFARQTDQLDAIRRFYGEGLGLPIVGAFNDHAGFDGVMFGLPDVNYHLEFVQHVDGSPGTSPNRENLLVFYMPDAEALRRKADQLHAMGYPQVASANPYWDEHGAITIEDPDGWRIVFMPLRVATVL